MDDWAKARLTVQEWRSHCSLTQSFTQLRLVPHDSSTIDVIPWEYQLHLSVHASGRSTEVKLTKQAASPNSSSNWKISSNCCKLFWWLTYHLPKTTYSSGLPLSHLDFELAVATVRLLAKLLALGKTTGHTYIQTGWTNEGGVRTFYGHSGATSAPSTWPIQLASVEFERSLATSLSRPLNGRF